jgi:hypothetical protein
MGSFIALYGIDNSRRLIADALASSPAFAGEGDHPKDGGGAGAA